MTENGSKVVGFVDVDSEDEIEMVTLSIRPDGGVPISEVTAEPGRYELVHTPAEYAESSEVPSDD